MPKEIGDVVVRVPYRRPPMPESSGLSRSEFMAKKGKKKAAKKGKKKAAKRGR
jgi:hypothetical protein